MSWLKNSRKDKFISVLLAFVPIGIFFSRAVAMAAIVLCALLALKELLTKKNLISQLDLVARSAICIALVLLFIATPFAGDIKASFAKSALWLSFALYYVFIVAVCENKSNLFWPSIVATCALLFFCMLDGVIQRSTGISLLGYDLEATSGRLAVPWGNVNFTSVVSSFLFVSISWLMILLKPAQYKLIMLLGLCAIAIAILSGERSATIMLLLSMVFGAFFFALKNPNWRKSILFLVFAVFSILGLAVYYSDFMGQRMLHLFEQILNFSESPYGQLYKAAFLAWQDSPLSGVGASNFRSVCPTMMEAYKITYCDLHPHNYSLEFLSEAGIFAMSLWWLLIIAFILQCFKAYKKGGVLGNIAVVGMMTAVFHLFPLMVTQSIFSTWRGPLVWYSIAMWVVATKCVVNKTLKP